MQRYGAARSAGDDSQQPGFVLLYAEGFAKLPTAWPITQHKSVIGRDPDAEIHLPVEAVSRRHAKLTWEKGRLSIRDLNSTNGVLVDGRQVQACVLEHNSEVRIGDAILKYVDHDCEKYGRHRVDGTIIDSASSPPPSGFLVGGYQIYAIARELEQISKTNLSVMLLGESGTGKEVVAREIHRMSERSGPFVGVNCAAIPKNLLESELFGYKRGAFSGADRDKLGIIRSAHEGTLLLDEIGDMPLDAQVKLLRVLQSKEVYPVGSTKPETVDLRVICATHRNLRQMQDDGEFRQDVFARLNEYQLPLPPLRDRKEDVYMLLQAFLKRHERPDLAVNFHFMTGLLQYDWPYNVRELEACVKRCVALCDKSLLEEEDLPAAIREAMEGYGMRVEGTETDEQSKGVAGAPPSEAQLRSLLQQHDGNVAAVGRELGKARMQIHRWLKRYDISPEDFRES
ncbi:MAG: sigma 54-interacting transcriptional regulator [Polyangiaceae bacterium]|nr:sigma 54-interacting transcriptional regulator [Polyangiaceae bacterium]